ncbi:MAG: twin-arginine translocation signal domain-containing protein, partial [Candidatus Hermodarchaeia archaeon]
MDRRDFLKTSGALGGAAVLGIMPQEPDLEALRKKPDDELTDEELDLL